MFRDLQKKREYHRAWQGILLFCFAFWALFQATERLYSQNIFTVPVTFSTGSSLTINSGVPLSGTWAFQSGSTVDFTGSTITGLTLPVTLTGNVTGTGTGTVATTVAVIPDLVSEPGSIVSTNIGGPVAPASGFTKWYTDSTGKRFHDRNDTGATGTTVVGNVGVANNFVSAIDPSSGAITLAQPAFTNVSGQITLAQLPSVGAGNVLGNTTGSTTTPTGVAPATARGSTLLNIDQNKLGGDTAYTILPTDRFVTTGTTFTAARTYTLPAANAVNAGQVLTIQDNNSISTTNTLTVQRASTDTINPGGVTSFTKGTPYSSAILMSNGSNRWDTIDTFPGVGPLGYLLASDGSTGPQWYPTGGRLVNSSTANQTGFAADQYLTGSTVSVAAGDFKVSGRYHCVFDMTKTAAGTAAPVVTLRIGTTGTITDPAIATATYGAGTAVVDTGTFESWAVFRVVGGSAVVQFLTQCVHQTGSTGLISVTSQVLAVTSSSFNSTTGTKIGVSFNGGASFVGTNTLVSSDLNQP